MVKNKKAIKLLVMDVDGTLTDGKIYMGQNGELFKTFDIKDGYAIKEILPTMGIVPVIITARESQIVAHRCQELDIIELHQGCRDKIGKLREILKAYGDKDGTVYDLSNVAYVGDDLLDLQCIEPISQNGGYTACPADAEDEVRSAVDYVCQKNAGNGVVRELVKKLARMVI